MVTPILVPGVTVQHSSQGNNTVVYSSSRPASHLDSEHWRVHNKAGSGGPGYNPGSGPTSTLLRPGPSPVAWKQTPFALGL